MEMQKKLFSNESVIKSVTKDDADSGNCHERETGETYHDHTHEGSNGSARENRACREHIGH